MKQQKIRYKDVMDLGFTRTEVSDENYYNQNGYHYSRIELDLTEEIFIEWDQETRFCRMVRVNSPDNGDIEGVIAIRDLEHLKEMVYFFTTKKLKPKQNLPYFA
jgi:hypothetical protein